MKVQQGLKAFHIVKDLQAAHKVKTITECCHAVLGESHTQFWTFSLFTTSHRACIGLHQGEQSGYQCHSLLSYLMDAQGAMFQAI